MEISLAISIVNAALYNPGGLGLLIVNLLLEDGFNLLLEDGASLLLLE